ncbi:hypothetical protein IF1G_10960 [Cordyceps javanica]|uniref:Uncharacterized protein n=1 Tax=Cordyceps javanica TaxID=43265 RepID=A0A545ULJ2_9HYPO|nr:hypothetical protein IF1G_10960 [Cordyceps javanica]
MAPIAPAGIPKISWGPDLPASAAHDVVSFLTPPPPHRRLPDCAWHEKKNGALMQARPPVKSGAIENRPTAQTPPLPSPPLPPCKHSIYADRSCNPLGSPRKMKSHQGAANQDKRPAWQTVEMVMRVVGVMKPNQNKINRVLRTPALSFNWVAGLTMSKVRGTRKPRHSGVAPEPYGWLLVNSIVVTGPSKRAQQRNI